MAAAFAALVLLHGVVMRGPTQPVCQAGVPCSKPAAGLTLVFSRAGALFRARTDADGRYAIRLRPGTYGVRLSTPTPTGIGSGIRPRQVTVRAAATRVDFFVDTGIR